LTIKIPFNKPYFTGKGTDYIKQAVETGKISSDGLFTKKCQHFIETRYQKCGLEGKNSTWMLYWCQIIKLHFDNSTSVQLH